MQPRRKSIIAGAAVGALAVCGMALPSSDEQVIDLSSPDQVADAVAASPGMRLSSELDAAGSLANSDADEVTVDLDGVSVAFGFPLSDQTPFESADRTLVFTSEDANYASVLAIQDTAVQVTTVIASEDSPTEYLYEFSGDIAALELNDLGEVLTLNSEGRTIGAVEAPWAFDATGRTVPTRYVVDGLSLVQVVDHASGDFTYPLIADPTWSGKVLLKAFISDYLASNPGRKLSAWLSAYGRAMYSGGDITQFSNEGWSLLVGSFGAYMPAGAVRDSMKQQWKCHVLGGHLEYGTWDLETARPSNPNWMSRIGTVWPVSAVCNW
ncbi:hypothetical protein [Agrococcus sp. KRD186]|uniref:hypothetical protein n=1 Tax=Agrococcus sp. KRD186 TaxID=2729730 RepID=UPI0019D1486C|nr:hypothetical protein [Agrococcus sp. KRD186]